MTFDTLFMNPNGRTARGPYIGALITLLLAVAFYYILVKSRTGHWCLLMLLIPAVILHIRRYKDMGMTPLMLVVPAVLNIGMAWIYLYSPDFQMKDLVTWTAIIVSALSILWGLVGKSQGAAGQSG